MSDYEPVKASDYPGASEHSIKARTCLVEAEMPRYKSHKTVWALEIDSIGPRDHPDGKRRLSFRDPGYAAIDVPEDVFARYVPVPGDFYVVYADGHKSFSPRLAFFVGYIPDKG